MSNPSFILDSHAIVWWMADDPQLSQRAKKIIADTDNTILISSATLWEIAIKERKGILTGCHDYLDTYDAWHEQWGFGTLDIRPAHAVMAESLDWSHQDPFDRMLVAQSTLSAAPLVTCDETIRSHHHMCIW